MIGMNQLQSRGATLLLCMTDIPKLCCRLLIKGEISLSKKTLTMVILSVISLMFLSGIVFVTVSYARGASQKTDSDAVATIAPTPIDRENDYTYNPPGNDDNNTKPIDTEEDTDEPFIPATEMDLDPSSITVFVNKEFSLPKNYKPEDLVIPDIFFDLVYYDERTMMRAEAAAAIERLFYAAKNEGFELSGVSGYRSYARQKNIFITNILTKGKEHTLKYSAVPGTSEHQTGLTMDVSCEALGHDLSSKLAELPEGIWLAENAHRFGYIIRYPQGKTDITGYSYEPWHIRYVGKGLAKYLYENNLTLEEYYNYVPSPDFDFELLYADLINITPSPSVFPIDGDGIIVGENGEIIEGELGEEAKPTEPGLQPTKVPENEDEELPSPTPTIKPSVAPSITPSLTPSIAPSITPTITPGDELEDDTTNGTPPNTENTPKGNNSDGITNSDH